MEQSDALVDNPEPSATENDTRQEQIQMAETEELLERIHALETAQAVQAANQAGTAATQAATQAGMSATSAAAHAGTWSTMIAAAAVLVAGMFRYGPARLADNLDSAVFELAVIAPSILWHRFSFYAMPPRFWGIPRSATV